MILNQQKVVRLARKPLEAFLQRVQKELGVPERDVTICFVSDREIAGMNERFRRKKGPTDVLSFPAGRQWRVTSGPSTAPGINKWQARKRLRKRSAAEKVKKRPTRDSESEVSYLGDIAIAPETARRYAKKNGRTLENELRVLILHGVLHLLGYDHETDRGEMDRLEQKLRRTFGLV
jgi:probable rRNA maturation factor